MNQDQITRNLKKGGICFAVISCIILLFNLYGAVAVLLLEPYSQMQPATKVQAVEISMYFVFNVLFLLFAAIMFVRVAKDGRPFTKKNARSVRNVGILFLLSAICPAIAGNLATGFAVFGNMKQQFIRPNNIIAGVLLLFLAYIMYYGAMLQQESDETL